MIIKKITKIVSVILCFIVLFSFGVACSNENTTENSIRYQFLEVQNGGYKQKIKFDMFSPIVKDGVSDYVIVISDKANEAEKHAADELALYIKKISGAILNIYSEKFIKNINTLMKLISIGNTELKNKELNYDNVNFNNDGFVIRTVDNTLFMFGGDSKRGTIYAVYEYLETCCGCRFFMPEVEKIPNSRNIYLPVMDLVDVPTFALREVVYNTLLDGTFSTKTRLSSERAIIDTNKKQFGEIHSDYFWDSAHNIATTIVPKSEYGDTHPEWYYYDQSVEVWNFDFACGVNDDGSYDDSLDINPIDVAVETLKQAILQSNAYYFNVSQADTSEPPSNAKHVARKEKIQESGIILQFLNLVCEKLDNWILNAMDNDGNKLFPNGREYKILTFAYGFSQTPPIDSNGNIAVKAHENVYVWLASCEFNCLYSYDDTKNQLTYVPTLFTGWEKCVDAFAVWDYYSNFASNACMYYSPYISTAGHNYRYFSDLKKVNYVFSEFSGASDWPRNEFDEIKTYCSSKLLWNPYRYNMSSLVEEYCNYVFGEQGELVLKVINANEDNFAMLTSADYSYYINHSLLNWANFIPLSLIENNIRIIDEAIEKNANSDIATSTKERIDLRLKKFKITISSNLLLEYASYYPIADINQKKEFTDKFFDLIEETKWNEYFGKWNNIYYDRLYTFKVN